MSRIRKFINALGDAERGEIALGLAYVIEDETSIRMVAVEDIADPENRKGDWFGHEDVVLFHKTLPTSYQELLSSGLTAADLSAMLMQALDCFEAHRHDPWYLLGREFAHSE